MLSGLEAGTAGGVDDALHQIDAMRGALAVPENLDLPDRGSGVPAEQLYVNQKITDLVSKAEMEQTDYRNEERKQRELNVFFGAYRYVLHHKVSVHLINSCRADWFLAARARPAARQSAQGTGTVMTSPAKPAVERRTGETQIVLDLAIDG